MYLPKFKNLSVSKTNISIVLHCKSIVVFQWWHDSSISCCRALTGRAWTTAPSIPQSHQRSWSEKMIKKKLMYLQVQGPSDTSNFDKYPRDEIVPGDEISGWDKEFWAFFKNVTKLLVRSKSVETFFVRTSAFKYLDSGDISWQPIVIQGCISRTAGRLLCKKPHLCSRTLLCIWKGAQDVFLYYAFDVQ